MHVVEALFDSLLLQIEGKELHVRGREVSVAYRWILEKVRPSPEGVLG
jgi:hypothetical protein